jgi:hypothetical protein
MPHPAGQGMAVINKVRARFWVMVMSPVKVPTMPKFSLPFKHRNKKQPTKVRKVESVSSLNEENIERVSPLAEAPVANDVSDAAGFSGIDVQQDSPHSPWPLSALLSRPKWQRFLISGHGAVRRHSLNALNSFRRSNSHNTESDDLRIVIPDARDRNADRDVCRSPLQKYNLCRTAYFTFDPSDSTLSDEELIDRREFIVVVAASMQKFGAATHLIEAFTDAVAKVRQFLCKAPFRVEKCFSITDHETNRAAYEP